MKSRKKVLSKTLFAVVTAFAFILLGVATSSAKVLMRAPDGRVIHLKGGTAQTDLSAYRSPLESKVLDRRFYTGPATFLANEGYKISMTGYNDMIKAAFPIAYKKPFQWVTSQESYWMARNLLSYVGARSHLGISMVQGPYWTMKARQLSIRNKLVRDRGERILSNKDYLLGVYIPNIRKRIGFPRAFDDASVTYLQYKSGDPRFVDRLDGQDNFVDPQSGKKGGWGVPNSYLNYYNQRWDHDRMDVTFDMGVIGQFLKRRAQWADYMFHSDHIEQSPSNPRVNINLLGNDAEEGFRGFALNTSAINTLLQVKSAMFTDGEKLVGVNPITYDPKNGLRYIPSEIEPDILWAGDLPERLWALDLKDNTSRLWVQTSWLWGITEMVKTIHRYTGKIYTENPPVDGGLLERKLGYTVEALGNMVFKNIEAMHQRNGILVSTWTPGGGKGNQISMKAISMAIVALRDMEQRWNAFEIDTEIADKAMNLLTSNADFLLKAQNPDGSFYEAYSVPDGKGIGAHNLASPNWAGIRAFIDAYYSTEETKYLEAARKTFNLMNQKFWVEKQGVYRSRLGDDTVIVTPYDAGITLAALREMMFTTPTQMLDPQIERFTRWWVQTMDMSGFQQAEQYRTGELFGGVTNGDEDADGIPAHTKAFGKYGIAPVVAGKVAINVGGSQNSAFYALEGETNNVNRFAKVKMTYQRQSADRLARIILPVKMPDVKGAVERGLLERYDGTLIPLPMSKPIKVGLGIINNLTGKQIFDANCSNCHGEHGEGITGLPLSKDMDLSHDEMFKVPKFGRFEKLMPPWGIGNDDGLSTMTDAEIDLVVNYVQSPGFKKNLRKVERGEVVAGSDPKDVYFYLSRENLKAGGRKIATFDDIRRIAAAQKKPADVKLAWWMNIPRIVADADLTPKDVYKAERKPLPFRKKITGKIKRVGFEQ